MSSPQIRVNLFGTLTLWRGDKQLEFSGSASARSLLAYLLLHRAHPQSRIKLAGSFWPEMDEARARRALTQALWRIRNVLPELLGTDTQIIQILKNAPLWIDVEAFDGLAAGYIQDDSNANPRDLRQAIELYRGDLLEGFYDDWVLVARERLRELYLRALERMIEFEKSKGGYTLALDFATKLTQADPYREAAHREVMRLYYALDRPEAALSQYETCCRILEEEFGLDADQQTRALAQEIAIRTPDTQVPYLPKVVSPVTPWSLDESHPAQLPLFGRNDEREELIQLLDKAIRGFGGSALIEGEAGVGKTRLVQELARDAEWRGAQVLWGYGRELEATSSYGPLVDALDGGLSPLRVEQLAQLVEDIWLQVLSPLLENLAAHLPANASAAPLEPHQERPRLLESLFHLLRAWAEITPVLLILEDIHWFDDDTLSLLPEMCRRLNQVGILIICTYRGEEARAYPALWEKLQMIDQVGMRDRVCIHRLDAVASGELIRYSLGLPQSAPIFEKRVYTETDGNPLFVLETLRALHDEGLLTRDEEGGWSTPWDETTVDYAELPISPGMERTVVRRLQRLPDYLLPIIQQAAVLGERFEFGWLRAVCGHITGNLLAETRELIQYNLLEETTEGYRFSHGVIRRAVYEQMDAEKRAGFHKQVGEAIEKLEAVQPATLAYHFDRAGKWHKAIHYHYQAGLLAMNTCAYVAAREHFSQAVSLSNATEISTVEQFDLFAAREKALDILGDRQTQSEDLEAMEQAAQGNDARLCQVALRRSWLLAQTNRYEEAKSIALQAQELGKALNDIAVQAEAWNIIGTALTWQGKTADSIAPLRNAVELAQQSGDFLNEARYRRALGSSLLGSREYDAARSELEISLQRAARYNDLLEQAEIYNLLGIIHMEQGDSKDALQTYEQSLKHCRKIGFLYGEGRALVNLGNLYYFQGRFGEMLHLYSQAVTIFELLGEKRGEVQLRLNRASISLNILGNFHQVRADVQFALDYARQVDDPISLGQALTVLAEAERQEGNTQKAREHLEEGIHVMQTTGDRWLLTQEYRTLGYLNIEEGRFDDAIENLDQALAICQQLGLEDMQPPILAMRGLALVGLERFDEALQATEKAVERLSPNVEQGYLIPYWHAQALKAVGHSSKAHAAIQQSYEMLQQMLSGLPPELHRQSMENIQEHRAIAAAWQECARRCVNVRLPRADVPLGRPLKEDEYIAVAWTVETPTDEYIQGKTARRQHRLLRLLKEAQEQGAAPTVDLLANVLDISDRTIKRDLAALRLAGHQVVTRGSN